VAESVGEILSALLIRLRDPAGMATPRVLALDMLMRSQQYYNESLRLKLTDVSFFTQAMTQFYPLTSDLGLASVSHVTHQQRDLFQVTFADLRSIDRKWHRALSDRYECFIPLGFTHFLLWPGLVRADTVTLTGPVLTPATQAEPVPLSLSQERTPLLIQLAEMILLNRLNDADAFGAILPNFKAMIPKELLKE
jgi:hypothetical protein